MFCSTLVTLLESQVYGNAAVLGMVKDLGLYSVASVDPLTLNLNKYSWSVSITSFAVLVVRSNHQNPKCNTIDDQ